jgi:hypothetical protein
MVKDPSTVWVGLEYFCNEGDSFWSLSDPEIQATAIRELEQMGLATVGDVLDSTVLRVEKTYPAYFGTYDRFDEIKAFTDSFPNLFLVGRNGMHKYNNSDHSMLTAMVAVDNIIGGVRSKENIWSINTEQEYHEEKSESPKPPIKTNNIAQYGFKQYLFRDKTNRRFAFVAAIGILLQFCIFKHFYPMIGFINGDSYSYLGAAMGNTQINTYPVGYSKFLRIFNTLTTSDTALVAFQYLFIQLSALYFLFTLFYFYRPARATKIILFAFVLFNPIFLYIANYVLSDAIFIPLSLTWFTLLIWTVNRPTKRNIILNALVLFLAFTVRYNALYYPLIAVLALFLTRQRFLVRLGGIALGLVLIGLFVWHTTNTYVNQTGTRVFTPFTGWQTANNAMYAYRFVQSKDTTVVPANLRSLDKAVRTYFDTTKDLRRFPWEQLEASTVYMWSPNTPLPWYKESVFKKKPKTNEIRKWATVAPLYAEYGFFLIRQYPLAFAKHYLLPNAIKYYAPPVEFLDSYNMGIDSINPMAQAFFNLPDKKVRTAFHDLKVNILDYYPILSGSITVIFLLSLLAFSLLQGDTARARIQTVTLACRGVLGR